MRRSFDMPPPHLPRTRLTTRQFLGELEVRQILPPSCRFPPRAGGTKQRFPLRSRGNLTEGVFKKCRAMSVHGGETATPSPRAGRAGVGDDI
jgi:hypothetical protein